MAPATMRSMIRVVIATSMEPSEEYAVACTPDMPHSACRSSAIDLAIRLLFPARGCRLCMLMSGTHESPVPPRPCRRPPAPRGYAGAPQEHLAVPRDRQMNLTWRRFAIGFARRQQRL